MGQIKRNTLLFVSPSNASFVKQDAEILAKDFTFKRFEFGSRKGFQMIVYQFKLYFWLLWNLPRAQVVFVWFADYHSFLPTLLAKVLFKKSIVVIGGYDAARLPEFNYGGHNQKLRSRMIKRSCGWATKLLPVSNFVSTELTKQIGSRALEKREVIYNGVDLNVFPEPLAGKEKRKKAICVSIADSLSRVKIKGLDRFAEVARQIPDEEFVLIGVSGEAAQYLTDLGIKNLTLISLLKREELIQYYQSSKVVCQFSRFESFGMALAEGMLCGCIPVTIAGIGAAEVVSKETGFCSDSDEVDALVALTRKAMSSENEAMGVRARERIIEHFGLKQRGDKLKNVLLGLGMEPRPWN